jgi:hypothetical protein
LANAYFKGEIQARYSTHRTTRNAQQAAAILSPTFQEEGLIVDPILQKITDPTLDPGFTDPRHSLVFWARPPLPVKTLISEIQARLQTIAPKLWIMPADNLHMTVLEVTHSVTEPEINAITKALEPAIKAMTDITNPDHRARLIKPFLSHDRAALALSFLPAAKEGLPSTQEPGRKQDADGFTYHHLRRAVYAQSMTTPVKIQSRYIVPSAHVTIGRFLTQKDHDTAEKMKKWVEEIDSINEWLKEEFWPKDDGIKEGGEWVVGKGSGLVCRVGKLWYGGGETVRHGEGF